MVVAGEGFEPTTSGLWVQPCVYFIIFYRFGMFRKYSKFKKRLAFVLAFVNYLFLSELNFCWILGDRRLRGIEHSFFVVCVSLCDHFGHLGILRICLLFFSLFQGANERSQRANPPRWGNCAGSCWSRPRNWPGGVSFRTMNGQGWHCDLKTRFRQKQKLKRNPL